MLISEKGGDNFYITDKLPSTLRLEDLSMELLNVIKKYYLNLSDDELKEIQEIVYLLSCAVMQQFYGSDWMGNFEEQD